MIKKIMDVNTENIKEGNYCRGNIKRYKLKARKLTIKIIERKVRLGKDIMHKSRQH